MMEENVYDTQEENGNQIHQEEDQEEDEGPYSEEGQYEVDE